jgi:hypothetical protein
LLDIMAEKLFLKNVIGDQLPQSERHESGNSRCSLNPCVKMKRVKSIYSKWGKLDY